MKRAIVLILLGAAALSLLGGCADRSGSGEAVVVEPVSALAGGAGGGLMDRYAGKVVAGETAEVKRDSGKTILETYVEEGDIVKAGDVLFAYDTEAMQLDLDKLYLEKEKEENTIASAQAAISELEKERNNASSSNKLSYTLQIDTKQADIREAEYNIALKERDIAAMEASLENAEITSPIAGRVMSVDEEGGSGSGYYYDDSEGNTNEVDFITVTDVTRLRVEGQISELNAYALSEGMEMLVRSRIDETVTWSGTLSLIDWEHPVEDSDNSTNYYGENDGDEMTTASKYPFYIELANTDGLLLGQHVYIEPDADGGSDESAGLMIPSYYIGYEEDGSAYLWAANDKDKLEKRAVTLGVYQETTDCYEITEGLSLDDYIAFPTEDMEAGQSVERYDPAAEAESTADSAQTVNEAAAFPMG